MTAAPAIRWWEALERERITAVAIALGLVVMPPRGAGGGTIAPCPACDASKRHTKRHDSRGAIGVRRDGRGARCFQCNEGFTGSSLICWVIGGRPWKRLADVGREAVRDWVERYLGGAIARPRPVALPEPTPAAPELPPLEEVRELWAACKPVVAHAGASRWLREERRIDPELVLAGDLARARPEQPPYRWTTWWPRNELIVPLYDATGQRRSLIARSVRPEDQVKSLAWRGYTRAGLVMADGHGREILRTGHLPAECAARVIVCEGEPDFLTAATTAAADGDRLPAVFGIVQGAWTDDVAARIPSGIALVIAQHADEAGQRFFGRIWNSVAKRAQSGAIAVERWRP